MHGSGDAFTGGYLVPWLFGGSPGRCLAAGAAAAAERILGYRGPAVARGPAASRGRAG
jgi:sugar/nucleoside kinase (ribokinase family)